MLNAASMETVKKFLRLWPSKYYNPVVRHKMIKMFIAKTAAQQLKVEEAAVDIV